MAVSSPSRGKWGSKIGFILAASGSAVGLGNIWRFPYTAGENGGALFLFFYLVSILMIAWPVLIAETAMGRFTGKNPVGAFSAIRPKGGWKLVGYLGVLTGVMILSFYSMIAGWSLGYFFKSITGGFSKINSDNAAQVFGSFSGDTLLQIVLLAVFLFLTILVVSRGVSGGIEKFAKILMPGLFIILILLLLRSLTLPGAGKGLEFYLNPDFSKLSPRVVIDAMGQAFFSLSLGMGAMITYGSYLKKDENLPSATAWVAFFDTFIAVMAGFIIFPAIFSQGMNPAGGPPLVFNILPVIFAKMPLGTIFGPLFFALLCIAALTSTVSLLEVATAYCVDEKKWSRKKSTLVMGGITFLVGIPSVLSYGDFPFFRNLPLINKSFFGIMDLLWTTLALSIGALFIAIFVGYIWKTSNALKEVTSGTDKFRYAAFWSVSIRYLSPLLIILILLFSIIK
jgi:NSS family neurotransmitter:Na+ symporter